MDDIVSLIQKLNSSISNSIRVCMPGTIESYDFKTQKANVKISMKELYNNGKEVDYPVVSGVPVVFMSAGGASITLPVNKGDPCIIFFADRDMSNWLLGGVGQKPSSTRMHNLSDAIAIMGLQPFTKVVGSKNNEDLAINYAGSNISITKTGDINITTTKTVNVKSTEVINIESKDINITSDEAVSITSKNLNIKSAETVSIESKNTNITSTETTTVTSKNVNIKSAETVAIDAKNITLNASESVTTTCKDAIITASNEIRTTAVKFIHKGDFTISGNLELGGVGSGASGAAITFKGGINSTGDIVNTGNITNSGSITSTGAITSGSVTLGTHTHTYTEPVAGSTPTAVIPGVTGTPL